MHHIRTIKSISIRLSMVFYYCDLRGPLRPAPRSPCCYVLDRLPPILKTSESFVWKNYLSKNIKANISNHSPYFNKSVKNFTGFSRYLLRGILSSATIETHYFGLNQVQTVFNYSLILFYGPGIVKDRTPRPKITRKGI